LNQDSTDGRTWLGTVGSDGIEETDPEGFTGGDLFTIGRGTDGREVNGEEREERNAETTR
jgi:hypothetical protein